MVSSANVNSMGTFFIYGSIRVAQRERNYIFMNFLYFLPIPLFLIVALNGCTSHQPGISSNKPWNYGINTKSVYLDKKINAALAAYRARRFAQAIDIATDIINGKTLSNKKQAAILSIRAKSFKELGLLQLAINDYQASLKINPDEKTHMGARSQKLLSLKSQIQDENASDITQPTLTQKAPTLIQKPPMSSINKQSDTIQHNIEKSAKQPMADNEKKRQHLEKQLRINNASPQPIKTAQPITSFFELPIGCFTKSYNIQKTEDSLNALAMPFTLQTKQKNNLFLTCIIAGPYSSRNEAIKMRTILKKKIKGPFNKIFERNKPANIQPDNNTKNHNL